MCGGGSVLVCFRMCVRTRLSMFGPAYACMCVLYFICSWYANTVQMTLNYVVLECKYNFEKHCVELGLGKPWMNRFYARLLLPESNTSYRLAIFTKKWFSIIDREQLSIDFVPDQSQHHYRVSIACRHCMLFLQQQQLLLLLLHVTERLSSVHIIIHGL